MSPLTYAIRRRFAIALSHVRLNRVRATTSDGRTTYIKTRYVIARLLVPLGNLLMRCTGEMSEVLSERQWRDWEKRVADASVISNANQPSETGTSLHLFLRDSGHSPADKWHAVELALTSLLQMHQHEIRWNDGQSRRLSHGDATCRNVCIEWQHHIATWIDFDTRHRRDVPAVQRFSDDVRTLICSSAIEFSETDYPELAERCWRILPSSIASHFRWVLSTKSFQTSLLQLAQAPLRYEQRSYLQKCLKTVGDRKITSAVRKTLD